MTFTTATRQAGKSHLDKHAASDNTYRACYPAGSLLSTLVEHSCCYCVSHCHLTTVFFCCARMRSVCEGLPPTCDRVATWPGPHIGADHYRTSPDGDSAREMYGGQSCERELCSPTSAVYAFPATCADIQVGRTCQGAALCPVGVAASATATCTFFGWSVEDKVGEADTVDDVDCACLSITRLISQFNLCLCLPVVVLQCAVCEGAPPAVSSNAWPASCKNVAIGSSCQGQCADAGSVPPVATCVSKRLGYVVTGSCAAATCSGPLPSVTGATWPACATTVGKSAMSLAEGWTERTSSCVRVTACW